jgi:hypothetical protein
MSAVAATRHGMTMCCFAKSHPWLKQRQRFLGTASTSAGTSTTTTTTTIHTGHLTSKEHKGLLCVNGVVAICMLPQALALIIYAAARQFGVGLVFALIPTWLLIPVALPFLYLLWVRASLASAHTLYSTTRRESCTC